MTDWKDNFKEGKELTLVTSSKEGNPHANIVISLGFIDGKILLADCQMVQTIQNLKDNYNICVVSGHLRLKGKVEIFHSGYYFDICVQKNIEYIVKNAVLITVTEIFDLDKVQIIKY